MATDDGEEKLKKTFQRKIIHRHPPPIKAQFQSDSIHIKYSSRFPFEGKMEVTWFSPVLKDL